MQAKRKLFDCSEKGYALRLNQTDKLNNMHRETVYYNREVRNKSIGLIFLPQLFFTFYFTGLERVSKQKENAQRHWQSIHDAGHIKQGLAALRHHNAKRKKMKAKTVVKRRSAQDICSLV